MARERLRHRKEFLQAYREGTRIQGTFLVAYILDNQLPYHRLGLTVSRKIGGAVVRNRTKRRLREAFRQQKPGWAGGQDWVMNARRSCAKASLEQLRREFLSIQTEWQRRAGQ